MEPWSYTGLEIKVWSGCGQQRVRRARVRVRVRVSIRVGVRVEASVYIG